MKTIGFTLAALMVFWFAACRSHDYKEGYQAKQYNIVEKPKFKKERPR